MWYGTLGAGTHDRGGGALKTADLQDLADRVERLAEKVEALRRFL